MRGLNDQSVENFNQLCETIRLNLGKSLKPKEVKQITECVVKNFKVVNSICEALGVSKIYNQDDYINLRKTRDIKFKSVDQLLTYIEKLEKDVSIIPTLKTQIEKLVAGVDTLTKENSSLKSEATTLKTQITNLKSSNES
ncbi:hypothetical protein, partial [Helicobacter suis]|uniref:hypothetical protein n=1 Tax=Helicobacter suis TaxID=104628 RepID=UPI0013D2EFBD